MSPVIRISDETYRRLESLAIGFDTPTNVIEKLLDDKGVDKMETVTLKKITPSSPPDLPASEFKKMHRIEGWAKKDKQPEVARIVQNYIDLTKGNAGINCGSFIEELEKKRVYKGHRSKIKNNLAQMKSDNGNEHARIFYDFGDKLIMYDAVYIEVLKYFKNASTQEQDVPKK